MQNTDEIKSHYSLKVILIPALVSLFIISYEDFLNNILIQPLIYILKVFSFYTLPSSGNDYITFVLLVNLVLNFAALSLIYFLFFKKTWAKQVANKNYGFTTTLKVYTGLFALVTGLGLLITSIIERLFPNISTTSPYDAIFPHDSCYSYLNLFLVLILVCVFAPILEETIFRRILIPLLEGSKVISTAFAVIISAAVFAFIHSEADLLDGSLYFAIVHFTSAFILGLGLASVYVTTRNVKYNIFYHSLNNALALGGTVIVAYYGTDPNNVSNVTILYGLFLLVFLLSGVLILVFYIFNLKKVFYPLKNQFQDKTTNSQKIFGLFTILVIQAIIFIIIPAFDGYVLNNILKDSVSKLVFNGGIYIITFLIFIFVLRRELNIILRQNSVINPPLEPYEQKMYRNYYNNQFNPQNPTNQNFSSLTPYNQYSQQNMYPNQPMYQNPYQNNQNLPPYSQNFQQQPYSNQQYNQNAINQQTTTCPNCKTVIPAKDIKFCPACGFKIL